LALAVQQVYLVRQPKWEQNSQVLAVAQATELTQALNAYLDCLAVAVVVVVEQHQAQAQANRVLTARSVQQETRTLLAVVVVLEQLET
jgi:hypothetical protein